MASGGNSVINGKTAVSVSLLIMVLGALVGAAVTWGKMQAQLDAKLDKARAAEVYATRADLHDLADQIDRRLTRIESKLDRLLEKNH